MAVGYKFPASEFGKLGNLSASFPDDRNYPRGDFYKVKDSDPIIAGALTDNRPTSNATRNIVGYRQFSFFDDYYNRIYIIPAQVNFGAVTADVSQQVLVWNAYTSEQTLDSITEHNTSGLQLVGPSLPTHFNSLQYRPYTLIASGDGPAYIDARYEFRFTDVATVSTLRVAGSRAELWALPPQWSGTYDITYSYKTDVFESRSGIEQRRALRNTPRKTFEFQSIAYAEGLRWFNRAMGGWLRNTFLMPELTRSVRTTSAMPENTAQVSVDSVPYWLVAGASVVLIQGQQRAARLIESVVDNLVTFTSIDTRAWQSGISIYPGISGRLQSEISTNRLTSEAGTVGVVFNATPTVETYPLPPSPTTQWRDTEVLLLKPNYGKAISISHEWPVENVDFDRGRTSTFVPIDFSSRVWKAQYLRIGRAAVQTLLDVFHRAKGSRGSFYMPTWENDIPPFAGIQAGSNALRTPTLDAYRFLRGDPVFRNLAIFTVDGQVVFNTVQDITTIKDDGGEDSVLLMVNQWDAAIAHENILRICWMPLWRFASDAMTVSWITDEVATIEPSMRIIKDKP